jgi:hypothetical protein
MCESGGLSKMALTRVRVAEEEEEEAAEEEEEEEEEARSCVHMTLLATAAFAKIYLSASDAHSPTLF